MQNGYLHSRVLGTFFSPEAIWTYWLIQVEWVQIPLYHCTLPLAIVSFQEKNKQPVIRFIFLQTDFTGCCCKGSLLDLASLDSGWTASCIFSGRCFVFVNYFPAGKSIQQAVTFAHIMYYWAF